MNHFDYRDGELFCEDVSLAEIAARAGTPVYVYSTATLERHYDVFREAVGADALIAYAVKANSNIAVIATLAQRGAGADTVSAGEIARALKAGVAPDKIIFSGVGKTRDELLYALEQGVRQINVESAAELAMLRETAAAAKLRAPFAIRVNPDVGAGGHDKITTGKSDSKFGVSRADACELYAGAQNQAALEAKGLAVHIGSQIQDLAPLESAIGVMRGMIEGLRGQGLPVERLDLGGGLGAPYFNEPDPPGPDLYAAMVRRALAGFVIELAFEPGRLIAGNAGVLVARVIRTQARAVRPILVVDAAMNDLIRPALYDSFHDIRPVRDSDAARIAHDVVGPICESGDTFAKYRPLPALEDGELVAFMTAGAYGAAMASTYNSRALVPEVLVRGAHFEIVRRRWDIEEQIALERLPDWLG